ncbi:hypothetical protein JAK51_03355 [Stenotrophomonas maltophilia]|uniref:hypothetical protein n=1 Tax=Stenotrophomonas maltophilia TaxID=40324 RepID=UPI0021C85C17|nr:hypothetical protein [Stenotrophomonas maltophilia]MCU1125277.1 hypothetical protein [Stenotrophomonas maltophilia]
MNRKQQLDVFQAQTANLRVLEQGWKHIKRGIHRDLLANNKASVELQTKVLALTYCAWSEVAFSKLVHTPHCFELDEIRQIKAAGERGSIVSAWEKCVALALRKIRSRNGNYVPNVKQELSRLIKTYIETPSQLRNKVAHGQWQVALNNKNTALNTDLTGSLANLDLVKLDLLKKGCEGLCLIVEALVESPEKAFHRDYWPLLCRVKEQLAAASQFTLSQKLELLKKKRGLTGDITLRSTEHVQKATQTV